MKLLRSDVTQKGQALVAVAFILVLVLSAGITISSRFLRGIHSFSQTNSLSRASAAAESLVERLLLKDNATLSSYITLNNCGSECTLTITGQDGIVSTANAVLSFAGNSTSAYPLDLTLGETAQVNLIGYGNNQDVWVCWNAVGSGATALSVNAVYVQGTTGSYLADSYSYNQTNSTNTSNGFTTAAANFGYTNCFRITGKANPTMIRVRPLYNQGTVYIVPVSPQSIPSQGIKIDVTGQVEQVNKSVSVTKSDPVLPVQFDYVLYTTSTTDPLSN